MEGGSITENSHFAFILGRQNGGELFDGDKPTFDSDPIVKGVSDYVNLIGRDKVADPSNAQYADRPAPRAVRQGQDRDVHLPEQRREQSQGRGDEEGEYGVAEVPVEDGSDTPIMTHVAGINVSVFKNSKKKAAALAFVKFLTSPEEQVKLNQSFGSLPVIKQAQSDPVFDTPNLKTFNGILADHAEPMPLIAEEGQMETFIGDAISS